MPQEKLRKDVISFKEKLQSHSIFDSIQSLKDLKTFSSLHIFVVWDYMSLVKSLQEGLNRRGTPWIPSRTPELTYLINSIALKEESEIGADGYYCSHYEMYRYAMQNMDADMHLIDDLMSYVEKGLPIFEAIERSHIPGPLKDFLEYTFWVVQKASLHEKAAVLCYGREGFGHQLLLERIKPLQEKYPREMNPYLYYLRRKNEMNERYHVELSRLLLSELCADDTHKWKEATEAATQSLRNRLRLFDFILSHMKEAH